MRRVRTKVSSSARARNDDARSQMQLLTCVFFAGGVDAQTASNQPFFALLAKQIATLEGGG